MKFEKFVKALGSNGVIYERDGEERWLASHTCFMLIPLGTQSVTAVGVQIMPSAIDKMIDQIGHTAYASLTKAIMPYEDGGIKDCVRVFTTQAGDISLPICNDDWSLIEKSDFCEILYDYDQETETFTAKALLVKNYPKFPDDEDELVGIIFPVTMEKED